MVAIVRALSHVWAVLDLVNSSTITQMVATSTQAVLLSLGTVCTTMYLPLMLVALVIVDVVDIRVEVHKVMEPHSHPKVKHHSMHPQDPRISTGLGQIIVAEGEEHLVGSTLTVAVVVAVDQKDTIRIGR